MSQPTKPQVEVRPWDPSEAPRLLDIRRRPEVAQWLGDPAPWTDIAKAYESIETWRVRNSANDPLGVWAIVPSAGPVAGTVSLGHLPADNEVEIGWYLHPDSLGHGYAAEAASMVLDQAADHGLERVWAIMWPDNEPSARVALAIGMEDLGVRADSWYGSQEDPDSRMFRVNPSKRRGSGP